jgi:hypothetical protein
MDIKELWKNCLLEIETGVSKANFSTWFKNTSIIKEDMGIIYVGVQRVFKGMRMAGRMGGDRVTVKNLEIVAVDPQTNELLIKGAVSGRCCAIFCFAT